MRGREARFTNNTTTDIQKANGITEKRSKDQMNAMTIELCRPNRNANLCCLSGGASVKAVDFAQVAMHSIQPS
jgi:hypothetical protein